MGLINRTTEAITWAMGARGLTPIAWKMLVMFAGRVNHSRGDFDVFPSVARIADDCEISPSSVRRHIKDLIDEGYVCVVTRLRPDGSTTSNAYRLQVRVRREYPKGRVQVSDCDIPEIYDDEEGVSGCNPLQEIDDEMDDFDSPAPVTADTRNELPKIELIEEEDSPMVPKGDDDETDLFGDPILSEDEAWQKVRESIIARVSESWSQIAEVHKNIPQMRKLDEKRRKAILARNDDYAEPEFDLWGTIFSNIMNSRFLTGRSRPSPGRTKSFAITLDWLLNPTNFKKVLEGNYHDERGQPDDFDPILGRRLTPIEAAGRSIKERILQSKERAAGRGTGKPQSFGSLSDLRGS